MIDRLPIILLTSMFISKSLMRAPNVVDCIFCFTLFHIGALCKGQINDRDSCVTVRLKWIFPILNSTISRSNEDMMAVQKVIDREMTL